MPKSKVEKEYQADEDGTVLIPKELVPTIPETVLKKAVKREMSDKQKANMEKVIAMNKEKWAKKREEKIKESELIETLRKEHEMKKIEAGTHVRMKLKEKVVKEKIPKPLPLRRQKAYEKIDSESDTDSTDAVTETETEVSESEDERPKARKVRREMKKNIRVVEKVNQALAQIPQNPYLAMLQGRWI